MAKRYKATNILWDIDMDEVLEKLNTMSVNEAAKALKCTKKEEKALKIMSGEDRYDFATDKIHHNVIAAADFLGIPTEIEIPEEIDYNDEDFEELISDCLSDTYGYCHEGFELEEIPVYKIIDERCTTGDPGRESKEMTLNEVKKYLGDEYRDCEDIFDVNEKLKDENASMAGYVVKEVD